MLGEKTRTGCKARRRSGLQATEDKDKGEGGLPSKNHPSADAAASRLLLRGDRQPQQQKKQKAENASRSIRCFDTPDKRKRNLGSPCVGSGDEGVGRYETRHHHLLPALHVVRRVVLPARSKMRHGCHSKRLRTDGVPQPPIVKNECVPNCMVEFHVTRWGK